MAKEKKEVKIEEVKEVKKEIDTNVISSEPVIKEQ